MGRRPKAAPQWGYLFYPHFHKQSKVLISASFLLDRRVCYLGNIPNPSDGHSSLLRHYLGNKGTSSGCQTCYLPPPPYIRLPAIGDLEGPGRCSGKVEVLESYRTAGHPQNVTQVGRR